MTHRVRFEISIDGKAEGSILIGLFGKLTPQTTRNFLALSSKGIDGKSYTGTPFHRSIKKFMIQGNLALHA